MIRPANSADAKAVRAVVIAAYEPFIARIGKPPAPMSDNYAQRIADGAAFVLEDGGRIRGVLILEHRPDGMLLNNVAVHPESQGRGYGRTLIAHAEAEARQHGYRQIRLYTHVLMTENQALYRRVGFIETGRVSEEGFDRVYMVKELI